MAAHCCARLTEKRSKSTEWCKNANGLRGEAKWTKICEYNESKYVAIVDAIFDLIRADLLKVRIMFTQNKTK